MSYSTRDNTQEKQNSNQVPTQSQSKVATQFADHRATTAAQLRQQVIMSSSPVVTAQRALMTKMAASPVHQHKTIQRAAPEEELQMKATDSAQLASLEEEPLQGKFATAQRAEDEELLQGKFAVTTPVQLEEKSEQKSNNTGLPDQLKSGIESLSGMNMDHVKVHYNSSQPAQLNAHAYAQGSEIHVAPGQEQHLPHEAWHVVQQAQGRVNPTMQMKGGVPVNDDVSLETEADVMGAKALTTYSSAPVQQYQISSNPGDVRQNYANRVVADGARNHYTDGWGARYGITKDSTLIASVPKTVRGAGSIDLGWHDAPESEQVVGDRRFQKSCWIGYQNANEAETTLIYHCGPSGRKEYYD